MIYILPFIFMWVSMQIPMHSSPICVNDMTFKTHVEKFVYDVSKRDGFTYYIDNVLPSEYYVSLYRSMNTNDYWARKLVMHLLTRDSSSDIIQRLVIWGTFDANKPQIQNIAEYIMYTVYKCDYCEGTGICPKCNGTGHTILEDAYCSDCIRNYIDTIQRRQFTACKICGGTGKPNVNKSTKRD